MAALNTTDLTIFQSTRNGDQCGGRTDVNCGALLRIGIAMRYYQALMASAKSRDEKLMARQCIIDFCDETYRKDIALADYIDVVLHHIDHAEHDLVSTLALRCNSVTHCEWTRRHMRRRARASVENAVQIQHVHHGIVDRLDTLHFNLLHLYEVGLRQRPHGQSRPNDDEKCEKQVAVDNFEGSPLMNSKFNLSVSTKTYAEGMGRSHFI